MPVRAPGTPPALRGGRFRLPGEPGVWIFALIDMTFFGLLFTAYVIEQAGARAAFAAGQATLDVPLGLLNTVVLLTSSWLVALAVAAVREDDVAAARVPLRCAIACGVAFGVSKAVEYAAKIGAGISPLAGDFFLFYFVITFVHLVHVLAGTVVLLVMEGKVRAGGIRAGRVSALESSATYWHMVDLLWVMIYPLLYLVRWR